MGNQGYGTGLNGIRNNNSISIELCINSDSNYEVAYKNMVELTKNLMQKFNLGADAVVRHYDATRKNCPGTMSANNWAKWHEFKKLIQEPIALKIDTSKDSTATVVGGVAQARPIVNQTIHKPVIKHDIPIVINGVEAKKKAYLVDNTSFIVSADGKRDIQVRGYFADIGAKVDWKDGKVIITL